MPELIALAVRHACPEVALDAGEKVFLKGEADARMYVVMAGAVEILLFGRALETVGPGGIFGEMAMIDDGSRSAAALAHVPTRLVAIDRPAFIAILAEEPEVALVVLSVLASRLRRANEQL
ncbi:MAG: Crp/Fnr family transcriptional regulator [Hyphomicrobiaceae bacterium]|nr:Crp/Fnr family transcriptional regulator [Hyphomicrobiaceae bacterium]